MPDILTADVLASEATDGEVRCRLGDAVKGLGYLNEAAIYGVDGFVGRPSVPDENGDAAQALYLLDGDDAHVLGIRDNRYADKVGTMDAGDRAIVSEGAARFFLRNERDALVLYTEHGSQGLGMLLDIGGVEGEIKIINGAGGTFIELGDGKITMGVDGGGSLTIDKDGVKVTGNVFQAVAPTVQLGDVGGGIAPPPSPTQAVAYTIGGAAISTHVFVV